MVSIGICSKILSTIASPALKAAYEEGLSIWEAKKELDKLKETIETIEAVLYDAESKKEGSKAVKNWIKRLKEVLYDAEDFFDGVLADDLLKEQMMDGKNKLSLKGKVRVTCSMLNPIVSRRSIAKKVKNIRERLDVISVDMNQLGFVPSQLNNPTNGMRREKNNAIYLAENSVIGRDEDKNAILKMLISESSDIAILDGPVVIAIDGIGGMGKTTIAHLIFNREEVKNIFENNRWFACISDTTDEKEVVGKIYQSICGKGYSDLTMFEVQEKIRESIDGKKYLLVLDDVWEDNHANWETRKSMLSGGAKGSKIIVTTRFQSVVSAMGAVREHNLGGLSEEGSWDLFKSLAFDSPYEKDPRRENVGRKLLQRCRGVPLAIRCMGSLLHNKTIQEWEKLERVDLPTVGTGYNEEIMSILKLSYDHLEPKLKQCFTYCCMYAKDHRYEKMEIIFDWISQGYINKDDGESCFMHLLRMGFFQEHWEDEYGEIESCKMHDIMHDLAMHVGGEEIIVMSGTSLNVTSCIRHVSLMVGVEEGGLRDIPTSLLNIKSLRSCVLGGSSPNLDHIFSNFKMLRSLKLSGLGIKHIPPSIGELKLVRYLDLSYNEFEELPDSISNLVNLLVLVISSCGKLIVWPHNFKKLVNLCSLFCEDCDELGLMPEGIGEMACLQYLNYFMVGKMSELDGLNRLLNQLESYLLITFCEEMEVEDELNFQLQSDISLQHIDIKSYPGRRIRGWGNNKCTSKLECLELRNCKNVKYLPPLSCLPILKRLVVKGLLELESMEDEEEVNAYSNATGSTLFFPCLEKLTLYDLPKLKGWRGGVAVLEFSRLSKVEINYCPNLESFPQCPNLRRLDIRRCFVLEKLHLESPHLEHIDINECYTLMSIELEGTPEPSLKYFKIKSCEQLKTLQIEEQLLAGVEDMSIEDCPDLRLRLSETQGKRLLVQQSLPEVETRNIHLNYVGIVLLEQLLSLSMLCPREIRIQYCIGPPISLASVALASLRICHIKDTNGIERLHIPSPHLQQVTLSNCRGLISVEVEATTHIDIKECLELKNLRIAHSNVLEEFTIVGSNMVAGVDWDSIPNLGECSCIRSIDLMGVDGVFIERLLSSPSTTFQEGEVSVFNNIGSLTVPPFTSLERFTISDVPGLKILKIQSQHLTSLCINKCCQLTNVSLVHPIALKGLVLYKCPELILSTSMDWDAFGNALTNLEYLSLFPLPPRKEIPECLQQLHALGQLRISPWRRGSQI